MCQVLSACVLPSPGDPHKWITPTCVSVSHSSGVGGASLKTPSWLSRVPCSHVALARGAIPAACRRRRHTANSDAPWTSSCENARRRREERARKKLGFARHCLPGSQFQPSAPQAPLGGVPGRAPAMSLPSPTELGGFSTLSGAANHRQQKTHTRSQRDCQQETE